MPEFIVRAHSAPTDPQAFLNAVGAGAHVEYLAQIVINSLFVSKGHRDDARVTLVMESSRDYSRAVSLAGDCLGSVGGMTESAVLEFIADALYEGAQLAKEAEVQASNGALITAISFERLVSSRLEQGPVFLLDRKGSDLRGAELLDTATFLLTDHVPLPKNLRKSLVRQGVNLISLGPVMLHASQCVVLVQNEYDRQGSS